MAKCHLEVQSKSSRKLNGYDKLLETTGEWTMLGKRSKQQGLFESWWKKRFSDGVLFFFSHNQHAQRRPIQNLRLPRLHRLNLHRPLCFLEQRYPPCKKRGLLSKRLLLSPYMGVMERKITTFRGAWWGSNPQQPDPQLLGEPETLYIVVSFPICLISEGGVY